MRALALLATLLLATVPSLARLSTAFTASANAPLAAMAAMPGMHHPGGKMPAHPMPGGTEHEDCAYCPLLHALIVPVLALLALLAQVAPAVMPRRLRSARIDAPHPCGLGSRGPPLTA